MRAVFLGSFGQMFFLVEVLKKKVKKEVDNELEVFIIVQLNG